MLTPIDQSAPSSPGLTGTLLQTDEAALATPIPSLATSSAKLALCDLPLSRRLIAFGFLLIAEFFYGWAWNTVDILRPFLRASLGLSLVQAGSAYSAQGAGALIGAITIGQLADRLGRRTMLVAVMAGYGLLLLAGVFVGTYAQLLLQRFVLGLFLGGSFPVVVGIYVDLFQPNLRGKLASAINTTFSSAIILLGIAFGHLGHHDWRVLFWLGGVPPVLLAGLAYLAIPESGQRSPPRTGKAVIPITELFTRSCGARPCCSPRSPVSTSSPIRPSAAGSPSTCKPRGLCPWIRSGTLSRLNLSATSWEGFSGAGQQTDTAAASGLWDSCSPLQQSSPISPCPLSFCFCSASASLTDPRSLRVSLGAPGLLNSTRRILNRRRLPSSTGKAHQLLLPPHHRCARNAHRSALQHVGQQWHLPLRCPHLDCSPRNTRERQLSCDDRVE